MLISINRINARIQNNPSFVVYAGDTITLALNLPAVYNGKKYNLICKKGDLIYGSTLSAEDIWVIKGSLALDNNGNSYIEITPNLSSLINEYFNVYSLELEIEGVKQVGSSYIASEGAIDTYSQFHFIPVNDLNTQNQLDKRLSYLSQLTPYTIGINGSGANLIIDPSASSHYSVLQAAFDQVSASSPNGAKVKIISPNLTFKINNEITIHPNLCIEGDLSSPFDGTYFTNTGGLKSVFILPNYANKKDYIFRQMNIKGKFTAGVDGYGALPAVIGITGGNVENILVEECFFQSCWNDVIFGLNSVGYNDTLGARNSRYIIMRNNISRGSLGGMQSYSIEKAQWLNNYFDDFGDDAVAINTGIDNGSGDHLVMGNTMFNGRPTNINGIKALGIAVKIDAGNTTERQGISNIICVSNTSKSNYHDYYTNNVTKVTIQNNDCHDTALTPVYSIGEIYNSTIKNNRFFNYQSEVVTVGGGLSNKNHSGILIAAGENIEISNNLFRGNNKILVNGLDTAEERGIIIQNNPSTFIIDSNKFFNVSGPNIYANCINLTLTNNKIYKSSNTSPNPIILYDITGTKTYYNNYVDNVKQNIV